MKTKIWAILLGCMMLTSCGSGFMDRANIGAYSPDGYFTSKERANQALTAAYGSLNSFATWGRNTADYHFLNGDEFYITPNGVGWDGYAMFGIFNIPNTLYEVQDIWGGFYGGVERANVALQALDAAKAEDATLTDAQYNSMRGQALVLRAFNYYCLYTWYPKDRIVLYDEMPDEPIVKGPSPQAETFEFIRKDLVEAQSLLSGNTKGTAGYAPERITRGTAAAILGKLHMADRDYANAATEFAKILPGSDGSYGTYSLVDYRQNFTRANKNNAESILELQFEDTGHAGNNQMSWVFQNFTMNPSIGSGFWWNFAFPPFQIDKYEYWTEGENRVYDYRLYATMWGVPNGASYHLDRAAAPRWVPWNEQTWEEKSIVPDYQGSYGLRKYCRDVDSDTYIQGADRNVINIRLIRLADIMLLYAECMANLNPSNVSPTDRSSAVYWVQQIRDRANRPMTDQTHLYSARPGTPGRLPAAADLMTSRGWSTLDLVKHERTIEGFGEGWRHEDLVRWQVGVDFDPLLKKYKPNWNGWQSIILPVPQGELNNNPEMPKS